MERVVRLTSFQEEDGTSAALEYWLSRPPEERIAEVERLRREYIAAFEGARQHGNREGLQRSLRLVERERS